MSATPPEMIVKNRFLGFLIWQSIPSSAIFLLFKTFISTISSTTSTSSSSRSRNPLISYAPSLITLLTFFTFHLSQLLFSASLSLLSSAHPHRPAYPFELILGLVRFLLVSDSSSASVPVDFRLRAKVSLSFVLFVAACAVSGMLGMVSMCWVKSSGFAVEWVIRGFGVGLLYGLVYIYKRRWVLEFPIIQVTFCVCVCVWVLFAFSEVFNLGLCSGWLLRIGRREFLQVSTDFVIR
jgi:nucleoporin NDC1